MNDFDPNREWRQLSATYAAMADEELQALAGEAYDLTDIGRQALQAEISRRGLPIVLQKEPQAEEAASSAPEGSAISPSDMDLVELRRVWDTDEATDIKRRLDAGGVPSYLGPDLVDDVRLLHASFEGGVAVKVRGFDEQRAMGVLANSYRSPQPGGAAEKAVEKGEAEDAEYAVRCPKCRSTEIVFQSLDLELETKSAFDSKFNWSCDACGYQWQDDGVESKEA